MNQLKNIHIGTSGWSYKHWQDIFYPADVKPARYLEFYTRQFSCVELNSSFYHLPKQTTVVGWNQRTPHTFKFCPKLSRLITHQKRLANIDEPLQRFFGLFKEMEQKLGPILIQLPPGLKFDTQLVQDFITLLHELYGDYRFAFEVRNNSWLTDNFFDLLSSNSIAFVIADSGQRFPYFETITADFIYLRFHGPETLYASDYSETALHYYAEKITDWLKNDKEAWIFFNNDYHGFAFKNARQLNTIVESQYYN